MATTIYQGPGGDWDVTSGRLRLERGVTNVAATKLRNRFKFSLGEWYRDVRQGIPYREVIFRKGTSIGVVKRIFTEVIMSVQPTIERVDRIVAALDANRQLQVYFEARSNEGLPVTGGTDRPFIVGTDNQGT